MTTLTKKPKLVYTPAVADSPGDPGSPPTPGYYTDAAAVAGPVIRWALIDNGKVVGLSYALERPPVVLIRVGNPPPGGWPPAVEWTAVPPPPTGSGTKVWVPPTPGRPPVPPVRGTPAKTETTFNLGWNSGAISNTTRDGDVILALKASPSSVGIVTGLNQLYTGNDYKQIQYGIYFTNGKAIVYENGAQKSVAARFVAADEFQIRRSSGVVSYYKGDALLYTSAEASAGAVFADASLYAAGDAITSAQFTAGAESSPGGTKDADSSASLRPLSGLSSDYGYTESKGQFLPLKGGSADSDQDLRPDYTLASAELLPLLSFSVMQSGKVGQGEAVFRPLAALSSDYAYTESRGSFQPLQSFAVMIPPLGSHAFLAAPSPGLRASGRSTASENSFAYTAPSPVLVARGGGNARLKAPSPKLAITATFVGLGSAELSAPSPQLTASGVIGGVGQASLTTTTPYKLVGYSGAICSITLTGKATLQASGTIGGVGYAVLTAPLFELTASGVADNYGSADLLAPSPRLSGASQAWLIAPSGRLTAIGSAVVAVSYEAYSINLSHKPRRQGEEAPIDEVTRYTNFPFDRIVRYQGSYFGVAADGLYLLEGTTDDGATIPYAVKTCIDDFKAPELKTVAAAYFGGRLGPDATITLHAGEQGQESYAYSTPRGQGAQNHREKFGRGVKNRYFAIGVTGEGALELDDLSLETTNLSRRI